MNRIILTTFLAVFYMSCNMSNLKQECKEIIREDYRPDNMMRVNSSDIKIKSLRVKDSGSSIIKEFGKEVRITKGTLYGKEYDSYHFNFGDNYIRFMENNGVFALSEAQFYNSDLNLHFNGKLLNTNTSIDDFRVDEMEAFCNCTHYEQENRYVLQYRGTIDDEIYELSFEEGNFTRIRVVWDKLPN